MIKLKTERRLMYFAARFLCVKFVKMDNYILGEKSGDFCKYS